jgi:hypothetical protein
MRSVEFKIWCPEASPLCVEFPADLVQGLGIAEACGVLYGSRHGHAIRILARHAGPEDEELEKVGVFVSRIRGEVFLTEGDLALFKQHPSEIALVVAGDRAGFFVREADGSIQTVRSHEEFCITRLHADPPIVPAVPLITTPRTPRLVLKWTRKWALAGLASLGMVPIAALAVFPQQPTPSALELRESGGQLRISWKPGRNAVLAIDDGGRRLSIPVYANQSNVTYAPRSSQVEVMLVRVDAENQQRREGALYLAAPEVSAPGR